MRHCGTCTLCCRLLPVRELNKGAGQRCPHQRTLKGCAVYHRPDKGFPASCGLWSCRWLVDNDCADLRRPDRSHYVLDLVPDYVTASDDETGARHTVPVVQIWIDPAHPHAHRDPALRRYLARLGEAEGFAAIVRPDNETALVLFPPALSSDGQWHEHGSGLREQEHSAADVARALSSATGEAWEAVHMGKRK